MMNNNLKSLFLLISLFFASVTRAEILLEDAGTTKNRSNEAVTYTFTGLIEHSEIFLNFDLFIMDSWDVDRPEYERFDTLRMEVDGIEIFSYRSHSEWGELSPLDGWKYGNFVSGSFNEIDTWGPIDRYYENFSGGFVFAHTGDTFSFTVEALNLSHAADESWVINNIDLETNSLLLIDKASNQSSDVNSPSFLWFALIPFTILAFKRK